MKVPYVIGRSRLELRDLPIPEPGPSELLVKIKVSAVSVGTEVWRYVNNGHYGGEGGTCGYNVVGQVVRVGPEVTRFKEGEYVFARQPHGEYTVFPEERGVKLPPGIDPEAATFSYLPCLGLHALRSADYQVGENVLVVGLGIIGASAAMMSRVAAARVAALDISPDRRRLAEGLRIGPVLDPRDDGTRSSLDDYFGGVGPDVILETSQSWGGLLDAVRLARDWTRIGIIGIYRTDAPAEVAQELLRLTVMNRDLFHNQRLKLIGCSTDVPGEYEPNVRRWNMRRSQEYVAEKIADGDLDTARLITHRFRGEEIEHVYQRFAAGERGMLGVILGWD